MTPSERLIIRSVQEEIDEGFDGGTATIRVAHRLGIGHDRVCKLWISNLALQEVRSYE